MQTTPETDALLAELFERSAIVTELEGPQIEAWVSGLFALFDGDVTASAFVDYCGDRPSALSGTVCMAMAELSSGIDDDLADRARQVAAVASAELPPESAQIGQSVLARAWTVQAPFGRSIVLGFDNPVVVMVVGEDEEPADLRHSILVEVGADGGLEDLQLAGPPQILVDEAAASDDRVVVSEVDTRDAVALVVAAWPGTNDSVAPDAVGPGLASNQQFVRRRMLQLTGTDLPAVQIAAPVIDVRRGLDDDEFADANRAARSTLQAAVGLTDADASATAALEQVWRGVVRGDGGDVSGRERDALLWLEWADWLGAGIGLLRGGVGAAATGSDLVDYVNRCPEVSSTIDKADRDYAEWAFDVALDVLADAGAVADGALTPIGHQSLGPALVAAWL